MKVVLSAFLLSSLVSVAVGEAPSGGNNCFNGAWQERFCSNGPAPCRSMNSDLCFDKVDYPSSGYICPVGTLDCEWSVWDPEVCASNTWGPCKSKRTNACRQWSYDRFGYKVGECPWNFESPDFNQMDYDRPSDAQRLGRTCKAIGWGDPHMVTFDGLKYDAQALGEVILSKSLESDYMIQGRFERFRSNFDGSPTGTFT